MWDGWHSVKFNLTILRSRLTAMLLGRLDNRWYTFRLGVSTPSRSPPKRHNFCYSSLWSNLWISILPLIISKQLNLYIIVWTGAKLEF